MKKQVLGIGFILIVSIGFNIMQYTSNKNLKFTILSYENELNSSEMPWNEENDENGKIQPNATLEDTTNFNVENEQWHMRIVPSVYMHSYVNEGMGEWFSAAGPVANINPHCLSVNPNNMKVLEVGDGNFTKISLEGYIPTWYLVQNESDKLEHYNHIDEEKYILKETNAYYGGDENSGVLKVLPQYTAINIICEYNDWYYIKLLHWNAVYNPEMWIKKDCVGLLSASDLENPIGIEVRVEKGTSGLYVNGEGEQPYIFEYTNVGSIYDIDDINYYVLFEGTLLICLEKEDVQFMGE